MFYYTFSVISTMFVPCIVLLYDSTAATRTLKLFTILLSISCGINLISFLMMFTLVCVIIDDVYSCHYFTKSVFQVPPQKIVRRVKILGIGWSGVIGLSRNESVPWEVMPEVFNCSVWEMRWRFISRIEQNTWIPQAKLPMGQTHFTSNSDLPTSQPA